MSPKKPYQKRLPTVLSPPHLPAPRVAPELEAEPPDAPLRPAPGLAPAAASETSAPSPAPEPPPRLEPDPALPSRPRAGPAVVLLLAAALVMVALGAGAWLLGRDRSDTPTSSTATWPAPGTSRTVTEVGGPETVEVVHRIHSDSPLDELDVTIPRWAQDGEVSALEVQVTADGRRASGPDAVVLSRATYVFAPATRIEVRYVIDGALALSTSAPGRGLLRLTALDVSARQPRDVRVVRSEAVLSLACSARQAGPEDATPCGEPDRDGQWSVRLSGADSGAHVIAAVTVS